MRNQFYIDHEIYFQSLCGSGDKWTVSNGSDRGVDVILSQSSNSQVSLSPSPAITVRIIFHVSIYRAIYVDKEYIAPRKTMAHGVGGGW